MKLRGRAKGADNKLHSKDATFCAVDVHPPELFAQPDNEDQLVCYTGVIVPQPEYFAEFAQWKNTEGPDHRLELLKAILSLVDNEKSRTVLCFSIYMTAENGWRIGQAIVDYIADHHTDVEYYETQKGKKYRFDGKDFGEMHAISMAMYAGAIVAMFAHISREVTRQASLDSLKKHTLQFLLDTVSGDPSEGTSPQWNKDLVLFIIENSLYLEVVVNALKKSCFERIGIEHARTNIIDGGEEIIGINKIPIMIAADWFAKICSRYKELAGNQEGLDEDDELIVEIVDTLVRRKCLIMQKIPEFGHE